MLPLHKTERKVLAFLRKHELITRGMQVCICFSGGVDSSVLLRIMLCLRDTLGIHLSACHFNHQIRGDEAERDEAFCASVCQQWGIPYFCKRKNVPALRADTGKSLEEAAREARYAWFTELGKKEGIDRFATAHHKNDQAETVLFHLIRGTTVAGLRGIPVKRGDVIRPLLDLTRAELEQYAKDNNVPFLTDSTNASSQYTRNYIRHVLLPAMERINPSAVEAMARLSGYAAEDQELLSSQMPSQEEAQYVATLPSAILRRTVSRNFTAISGGTLCYAHLDAICQAVREKKNGSIGLPGGYRAVLSGGVLRFESRPILPLPPMQEGVLHEGVTLLYNGALRITLQKKGESLYETPDEEFIYNLSTEIPFSCHGICGMIRYRSRISGDRILLHGVHHSVKKLFSERKVPIYLRNMIPVFCDDSGIFCIPFVAVADRVNRSETGTIYSLRVEIAEEAARKVVESL